MRAIFWQYPGAHFQMSSAHYTASTHNPSAPLLLI